MCMMTEVFAVKLDRDLKDDELHRLLELVSVEKRERIKRLRQKQDAHRSLIGDVLVRSIICEKLGIRNDDLVFEKNDYGKPILSSHQDVCFNIAHSGHWVVCCIDTLPVGIDIEIIKHIDINLAKRFFSEREYDSIMSLPELQRQSYFFELWSLKESYIKAIGKGMSIPLKSFTISAEGEDIKVQSEDMAQGYFFKKIFIDNSYKMAVCSCNRAISDNVKFISLDEICKRASLLLK